MPQHKTGRHHLGGGPPPRASQRRRQTKAQPHPLIREGAPITFRGQPATFIAHDGEARATILLNDRKWRAAGRIAVNTELRAFFCGVKDLAWRLPRLPAQNRRSRGFTPLASRLAGFVPPARRSPSRRGSLLPRRGGLFEEHLMTTRYVGWLDKAGLCSTIISATATLRSPSGCGLRSSGVIYGLFRTAPFWF